MVHLRHDFSELHLKVQRGVSRQNDNQGIEMNEVYRGLTSACPDRVVNSAFIPQFPVRVLRVSYVLTVGNAPR